MWDYKIEPSRSWQAIECRKLNRREKKMILSAILTEDEFGHSILFTLKNGNVKGLPLHRDTNANSLWCMPDINKLYIVWMYNGRDTIIRVSDHQINKIYSKEILKAIADRYTSARKKYYHNHPPKSLFETLIPY